MVSCVWQILKKLCLLHQYIIIKYLFLGIKNHFHMYVLLRIHNFVTIGKLRIIVK